MTIDIFNWKTNIEKTSVPDNFTCELLGSKSDYFYFTQTNMPSITLISEPEMNSMKKENYRLISLLNIEDKILKNIFKK